jgi:hypothetical protein
MNRRLMIRGLPARHAALQYAVFNPATREIQISSAGMPGPLQLSGKGCRLLKLSERFSRGHGPHEDMAAALFYCSE